jgi:hypothetical protein
MIEQRYQKVLELPRVLELLAEEAACDVRAPAALRLEPSNEFA